MISKELFERVTSLMSVEELHELVRLQYEVEQALDEVEFEEQTSGLFASDNLQALKDIWVMTRYSLRTYLNRMIDKYNQ